ncbi:MAG: helix-turn-helix domain-containing protein [Nitrospirae bacterium]|nr:helix-turn-helix domain-containing protein [Nitrospirota bacterium]
MAGDSKSFGEFLKGLRKKKRITLRKFCIKASADPANISRLERGAMPPPQDTEILERYAKALGIRAGSDDWYTFLDLAAADRGIIPKDLMSDHEVVRMLPAFFRTLRGQKPTEGEMTKLADKIRKS